ncbi:hypothetical protein HRI96_02545 [Treponema parvum]|uniref:Uncharacterized protein n=1 Tax=Treponema parvum TaxID=138851 RepID=A0A975EYS7_9SPIR|nr:hypothetical protein [Treponema parvum]QTQ11170.1 hypothetical protein HRI96_02545 [Treponema parvum]
MYGFYLKKNFCDGWDNAGQLIIVNLVIILYAVLAFFVLTLVAPLNSALGMSAFIVACGGAAILVTAYSEHAYRIACFETIPISDFFSAIPKCAKDGFLFGVLCGTLGSACFIGIPGYLSMKNPVGLVLGAMLFWLGIIGALSLQWFIPLRAAMHDDFKKCLKKCFLIFFDNTFFSIFVGIYTFLLFLLSFFLFFLIPSVSGILLAQTNALRLRLYKYDYLEQHPELKTRSERKNIPWDELIAQDKETLGPRRFRSFIFPWKD